MALFFDTAWFELRLAETGLSHADLARALGLSESELGDVWKDQRELSADDVRILAVLLAASPEDVAARAGVSTPVPKPASADTSVRLDALERRLAQVEQLLSEMRGKASR